MLPDPREPDQLPTVRDPDQRTLFPFFGADGEKCGHLFAGIVMQAYHDAFAPQMTNNPGERAVTQRDAISFLTAKSGEWRAHRNWVCTCAGIDGDALAHSVRNMLSGITSPHVKEKRLSGALHVLAFKPEQIEKARTLYAEMNKPLARSTKSLPRIVEKPKPEPIPEPPKRRLAVPTSTQSVRKRPTPKPLVTTDDDSDVLKDWFANMTAPP